MELKIFENGIQSHNQVIHRALLKNGLYVMHEKGYSYTVGMKNIGSPDLILFGQSSEIADEMFQVIFQAGVLGILPPNIAKTAAGRASCGFWRPITYRLSAGSHQSIPLNPQVLAIHLSVRMCIYPGG